MEDYIPFTKTGWTSRKVPIYGLPFFEIGSRKEQLQHILRFLYLPIQQNSDIIEVGVVKAEWGYGKTHLFLHLIEKILEERRIEKVNVERVLPIYIEFEDLSGKGLTEIGEYGEEKRRKEFCNILLRTSLEATHRYEETYNIPYSKHLKEDFYQQIDALKDKDSIEIFKQIKEYYDRVYLFIDEVESLTQIEDRRKIGLFFNFMIKKFVERKLPIKEDVTILLGCTAPIWESFMTYFGEIAGRYVRREDTFELKPLGLDETFSWIDQAVKLGGEEQENPFTAYATQTLSKACLGAPFTLLNLYNWVATLAIERSKVKGEVPKIGYETVFDALKDKQVYIAKDRPVATIDFTIFKRFQELFEKSEDSEVLKLFVGEFGPYTLNQVASKLRISKDVAYEIISKANMNCKKAFNRPLFARYRVLSVSRDYELGKTLRENDLLSEEDEIFDMNYARDFYPKITSYAEEGRGEKDFLLFQPRKRSFKISWVWN